MHSAHMNEQTWYLGQKPSVSIMTMDMVHEREYHHEMWPDPFILHTAMRQSWDAMSHENKIKHIYDKVWFRLRNGWNCCTLSWFGTISKGMNFTKLLYSYYQIQTLNVTFRISSNIWWIFNTDLFSVHKDNSWQSKGSFRCSQLAKQNDQRSMGHSC